MMELHQFKSKKREQMNVKKRNVHQKELGEAMWA